MDFQKLKRKSGRNFLGFLFFSNSGCEKFARSMFKNEAHEHSSFIGRQVWKNDTRCLELNVHIYIWKRLKYFNQFIYKWHLFHNEIGGRILFGIFFSMLWFDIFKSWVHSCFVINLSIHMDLWPFQNSDFT